MKLIDVLILILVLILAICLIIGVRIHMRTRESRSLQALLAEQSALVTRNAEQLETLHRIQHDAQNHFLAIRYMLENGKEDEAVKYIDDIRDWIRRQCE